MSDDLEIPLSPHTGSWPPNQRTERLKMWANVITTAAALTISVAAVVKPEINNPSKAIYEQMITQIRELHDENAKLYEDVINLRKYTEDFTRFTTILGPRSSPVLQPNNPNAPVILIPIDRSKIQSASGKDAQFMLVFPAETPPSLPELHPSPEIFNPPDFNTVLKQHAAASK